MKYYCLILFFWVSTLNINAQNTVQPYSESELSITDLIDGTLLQPDSESKVPLVIIIAGSGPTDRDGNQSFMKTNALKKLAIGLGANGIASFRYDKRLVKYMKNGRFNVPVMFDDFINDAVEVVNYFKAQNQYSSIFIIGHSQGSLIGMVAASEVPINGFISLAGAGQDIDEVIMNQVKMSAPGLVDPAQKTFDILNKGETTKDYPPALASVFDLKIQPFMMNWMAYHPQEYMAKLNMPVLILNGDKDLQVSTEEAELLKEAQPKATLQIIPKMNHVLFIIEGDNLDNAKSYNEPKRPIAPALLEHITRFIKTQN